jgi:NADH:ubiquinone oxidoreductase subunit K
MNWTDIAISLGLIILVLRQIRGRQLSVASLLWPVGLVLWAAFDYLGTIPGKTSDIVFTTALAAVGLALGVGCALLTRVYRENDKVMVKARPAAAALWIIGMCSRLVFGIVALHGGAAAIGRLSQTLDLHSISTWSTALITMALCEVLSRTLVLSYRYRRAGNLPAATAERPEPRSADGVRERRSSGCQPAVGRTASRASAATSPSRPAATPRRPRTIT